MKRWFVGLMLGLTAIFALTPMPIIGQTPATTPYTPPRTRDGHPDLQGIWQALNTAADDLEAHNASLGVPLGPGVVEGGAIPYQPSALARKKENFEKRATLDPETKCLLPGVPRITYMPGPFQIVQQADKVSGRSLKTQPVAASCPSRLRGFNKSSWFYAASSGGSGGSAPKGDDCHVDCARAASAMSDHGVPVTARCTSAV